MKCVFVLIFLNFSTLLYAQDIYYYRKLIVDAEKSTAKAEYFLERVTGDFNNTQKPIFLALSGVGNFFVAKNSYNPIAKLNYFSKGKKNLEKAVKLEPNNLEIRLLRYISQTKTPKILGYNENIQEDEFFLKNNYSETEDLALKNQIIKNIKNK